MCLSSWLLVLKDFPHISHTSSPGSIPLKGSSCKGGALGRMDRFLICFRFDGLVIKMTLHDKCGEGFTYSLRLKSREES
jgi:hypothetical protein